MAQIIPSLEKILTAKVKPEPGELHLLKFLDRELDDSFEVYFNPYLNGDRPDIVIMRKGYGVLIIEVKDFNLEHYEIDERKNWKVNTSNGSYPIKSPLSQVIQYKKNLFELHVENLLELRVNDFKKFNTVKCALYFHNATYADLDKRLIEPFEDDFKYKDWLKYNISLIGKDGLNHLSFKELLKKNYLVANRPSFLFTDEIYNSFKRFLNPPRHLKEDGIDIPYSKKQLEIIYESNKKQQRIKGVVGSGKTTVMAGRAVQSHKRTGEKVLILTFNITLKNYIRDKLSQVREDFGWENFIITSYKSFINAEMNNLGIEFKIPSDFNERPPDEQSDLLERHYYSNVELFRDHEKVIRKYQTILIDEIQDYKRPWMDIIKEYFLAPDGEYLLFGDVKQNIYNNEIEGKDVMTNVRGGVIALKNCFRSDFKIKDLAIHYQKEVFADKYEIDDFNNPSTMQLDFQQNQQGTVNYISLTNVDSVVSLYNIVYQNTINKGTHPNDITVLGHSISLLRKFEAYYRYASRERTHTMFETNELIYRMGINRVVDAMPDWLKDGLILIKQKPIKQNKEGLNKLCRLLTLYDLHSQYEETFGDRLDFFCKDYRTNVQAFLQYIGKYAGEIEVFKKDFSEERQRSDLQMIRKNKKLHFHMNSGTIKISTVHSFKGWECDTLFLIIEKKQSMSFDEVLYTGITRSRSNLVMINFGNEEYHEKLKAMVEKVK